MDIRITSNYEDLRERLSQVRMAAALQDIDHVSSLLKLSKEIGIGLSALGWFINNSREARLTTYGKILKYVIKMEKELGIK